MGWHLYLNSVLDVFANHPDKELFTGDKQKLEPAYQGDRQNKRMVGSKVSDKCLESLA